jgi:hypothetical protein
VQAPARIPLQAAGMYPKRINRITCVKFVIASSGLPWQLSDERLVNRKFESLDALEETLASRCNILSAMPEVIRQHILFH